jgi:hypothetical protein
MGFTLTKAPKYKEIIISGNSGGSQFNFWAKCRCYSVSEFKELTETIQDEYGDDVVGSDNGNVPLADAILVEWINKPDQPGLWLQDEDGNGLEFTPERKAELLNEEGVAFAIFHSYKRSCYDTDGLIGLGNSSVSRKSGSKKITPAPRNTQTTK